MIYYHRTICSQDFAQEFRAFFRGDNNNNSDIIHGVKYTILLELCLAGGWLDVAFSIYTGEGKFHNLG